MPATPRKVEITQADLESAKRTERDYDYNDIEVPGDYEAILVDVNDHKKGDRDGWKFTFEVLGCPFDEYVMFTKASKWKLVQTLEALGYPVEELGIVEFDPNAYIGTVVGASIDWQTDPDDLEEGATNYREIKALFPASAFEDAAGEETLEEEPAVI